MSPNLKYSRCRALAIAALLCLVGLSASAGTVTYTDQPSFLAALPGHAWTLDFDSTSSGTPATLVPSGSGIGPIKFSYSIAGLTMEVVSDFDTTSLPNSLGLNDPGNYNQFIAGDPFDMTFDWPIRALGLYFITTADPVFPGDILLVTPVGTATNAGTPNLILPDTGTAYFVGLVSDAEFTSAGVQFGPLAVGTFLYNVDDITINTPEPAAVLLWAAGLALLAVRRVLTVRPHR